VFLSVCHKSNDASLVILTEFCGSNSIAANYEKYSASRSG
jgi:hypothetical protein